jgi:hypothetical protein
VAGVACGPGMYHQPTHYVFCTLTCRAATDALRKKQMGVMAGFGRLMDDFMAQMNSTVAGVPEDMVTVGAWGGWVPQECIPPSAAGDDEDVIDAHNGQSNTAPCCNPIVLIYLPPQVGKRKRSVRWDVAAQQRARSPAPGGEDWFLVPPERALVPVSIKADT